MIAPLPHLLCSQAVQLFQGSLHYRCAVSDVEVEDDLGTCNPTRLTSLSDTGFGHDEQCPEGSRCVYFSANPSSGLFSFDSVLDATVPVLLALTFDDWSALMYLVIGATSGYSALFFVLLVTIGGFFVINLFLAVVFEQFIWTQSVETEPSVVDRRKLVDSVLGGLEFYTALTKGEKTKLADALEEEAYQMGDPVVVEGDRATSMYIIKEGTATVTKAAPEAGQPDLFLCNLPNGAFFGESAILAAGPDGGRRNASISAGSNPLILLKLSRETCTELLGSSKEVFEREARRRARETELAEKVLGKIEFYQALTMGERRKLVDALVEVTYEKGVPIVIEGDPATAMLVLKEGSARVEKKVDPPPGADPSEPSPPPIVVASIEKGTVFGESALLDDGGGARRKASIIATSKSVVLSLERSKCQSLLGSSKDIFERAAKQRQAEVDMALAPTATPGSAPATEAPDEGGASRSLWLEHALASRPFVWLINALVIASTVLMCLPYEGMSTHDAATIEHAIDGITCAFTVEMALKLIVLGWARYWKDQWHALDGALVTISVVDLITARVGDGVQLSFLRVLRLQRALRLLRMVRSSAGVYRIVLAFIAAARQMINLLVLLLLFMVVASLIGMQLFGGLFNAPPAAVASLAAAVAPLAAAALSVPPPVVIEPLVANSTLQLLPSNGSRVIDIWADTIGDNLTAHARNLETIESLGDVDDKPRFHFDYFVPAMLTVFTVMTGEWAEPMETIVSRAGASGILYFVSVLFIGRFLIINLIVSVVLNAFATDPNMEDEDEEEESEEEAAAKALASSPMRQRAQWPKDYSFGLFVKDGPIHALCSTIAAHHGFHMISMALVLASCLALSCDSPRVRLHPDKPLAVLLHSLDVYVWPWAFLGEVLIKAIAAGFIFGEGAYLKSWWHRLDFFVMLTCFLVLLAQYIPTLEILHDVRVLRVLRPLQLVAHNRGTKVIVHALVAALPKAGEVLAVVLGLQAMFAIVGMQLFMGSLASCSEPTILEANACVAPHEWRPPPMMSSFDSFGRAMLTLYVMATGDAWADSMFRMMDATARGRGPERDDSSAACLFSLVWMFVGSFFAMNLVVGVIVDQFNRIRASLDEPTLATPEQQQWVDAIKATRDVRDARPSKPPEGRVRRCVYDYVGSINFERLVFVFVIASVGVLSCYYWGIEHDARAYGLYVKALEGLTFAFYAEFALKMVAFGPSLYLSTGWARFDAILVVATLVDQIMVTFIEHRTGEPLLLRSLRLVSIMRTFRLLKGATQLNKLLATMVLSMPALINVGSVLTLVIFMYAVLGVDLFTFVAHQETINAHRNFETFGGAMLIMFQALTGDDWSGLLRDAMVREPECSPETGDCGSLAAIPFFLSFVVLGAFVFLSLVIAVIIERFSSLGGSAGSAGLVTPYDVERFQDVWATLDLYGATTLPRAKLPNLMLALPPPLGLKNVTGMRGALLHCMRLELMVHDDQTDVSFDEVLNCLISRNLKLHGFDNNDGGEGASSGRVVSTAKAEDSRSWTSLRAATARKREMGSRDKREASSMAKAFAMDLIAGQVGRIRDELSERVRAKSAANLKRRQSMAKCPAGAPTGAPAPEPVAIPAAAPSTAPAAAPVAITLPAAPATQTSPGLAESPRRLVPEVDRGMMRERTRILAERSEVVAEEGALQEPDVDSALVPLLNPEPLPPPGWPYKREAAASPPSAKALAPSPAPAKAAPPPKPPAPPKTPTPPRASNASKAATPSKALSACVEGTFHRPPVSKAPSVASPPRRQHPGSSGQPRAAGASPPRSSKDKRRAAPSKPPTSASPQHAVTFAAHYDAKFGPVSPPPPPAVFEGDGYIDQLSQPQQADDKLHPVDPDWRPKLKSDQLALERAEARKHTSAKMAVNSRQEAVTRHEAAARQEAMTRQEVAVLQAEEAARLEAEARQAFEDDWYATARKELGRESMPAGANPHSSPQQQRPDGKAPSPRAVGAGSPGDAEIRKICCGGTWIRIKVNKSPPTHGNHAPRSSSHRSPGSPAMPQSQTSGRTML